jgi:hypothetical protein
VAVILVLYPEEGTLIFCQNGTKNNFKNLNVMKFYITLFNNNVIFCNDNFNARQQLK